MGILFLLQVSKMEKVFNRKSGQSELNGLKHIRGEIRETFFFICGMLSVVPPAKVSGNGIDLSCGQRARELETLRIFSPLYA